MQLETAKRPHCSGSQACYNDFLGIVNPPKDVGTHAAPLSKEAVPGSPGLFHSGVPK